MAPNYVMMVGLIILICFSLSFGYDAMLPTHNNLIAKPNCKKSCGNVSIPFPFGVTQDCVLYNQFLVTCNYTFQPPRLFFYDSAIQITNISLTGQLTIFQFISKDCYESGINTENNTPWITLTPLLAVSNTANKFIAIGCDTYAIVQGYYSKFENMTTMHYSYITGCTSMCNSLDDADNNTCSGVGCCKTSIPKGAWNVTITLSSYYNHTYVNDNPSCSYAFVVEDTNPYANFSKNSLESLQNMDELPLVLDWVIGKGTCEIAKRNSTAYGCKSENSDCYDSSIGYGCYCMQGYDGNPYLKDGCQGMHTFTF
ncbi:wall-associated receptor kinase 2-like [Solanum verrucosum]|uniref:wall-associated receptor kinase 2-like n=1 Tax=Solanum verrucosum TaxID=315347 RepID=UPI0020D1AF27|nr:wall-associated receptor kinase 2-like [Solanum verrucosum]